MTNKFNQEDFAAVVQEAMMSLASSILSALPTDSLETASAKGLAEINETFNRALAETDFDALDEMTLLLASQLEAYRQLRNELDSRKEKAGEKTVTGGETLTPGAFAEFLEGLLKGDRP